MVLGESVNAFQGTVSCGSEWAGKGGPPSQCPRVSSNQAVFSTSPELGLP
jgi:hypothetical protein